MRNITCAPLRAIPLSEIQPRPPFHGVMIDQPGDRRHIAVPRPDRLLTRDLIHNIGGGIVHAAGLMNLGLFLQLSLVSGRRWGKKQENSSKTTIHGFIRQIPRSRPSVSLQDLSSKLDVPFY